jgi:exopolysaccharide production protein ExoQ
MNTHSTAAPRRARPAVPTGSRAVARTKSLLRYARWTDPAMLLAWVLFTTLFLEGGAAARYLIVAYFLGGMFIFARDTMPAYARAWPTLLLPILCFISAIWAPSASDAIRKGLLMGLTGTIAVYAASRLSVRQIVSIYFLGETAGAVLSIMNPNLVTGAWTGIFGQKNYLAIHMFILYLTGLVILLDKASNIWLRCSTLFFIPLAALLIFLSLSATTILMLGATTAALLGHAFVWEPASRVKHMRTFIIASIVVVGLTAGLLLFGLFQFDVMDTILRSFGKDSTLTGRTFIWDWGHRIMNEHPWTGVGASGFWRPNVGVANQILTFFFYEQFVKFSFHNSYLENGVQLGYPGYYATYVVAAWGLWSAARTWLRNQSLLNATFFVFAIMVVIRSNAEIDLALELGATAVLFFIGAARKEDLRNKAPPAPLAARQRGWQAVR